MAITPVSSSSAAVTTTQALRPQPAVTPVAQAAPKASNNGGADDAVKATQAAPPKPTINATGQTVGTLVNVTA